MPFLISPGEHGPLCDQNINLSYVVPDHLFQRVIFPGNTMVAEIPGKQDFLSADFKQKHIGIQCRMIYKKWSNPYIAKYNFMTGNITLHVFYTRQSFLCHIGNGINLLCKDFQNFLCSRTDVKKNILRNFLI